MDKTYNISLGGFAFNIDDAAYTILRKYLNDIKISLHNSPGVDEIIGDVEYRMAELLHERMMGREVVNLTDVDHLITVMGQPEDFYTEEFLDDEPGPSNAGTKAYYAKSGANKKKLFRDPDDKMLGGVASGLAYYIGVDRVWVRLFLVLMPFLDVLFWGISTSTVIFAYLILWLVVPLAKSTSDKLQMRGEPVNVDSIKDFFGNSPGTVRDNLQDFSNDARRVANTSGSVIGDIFRILFKVIGIFFIVLLLIVALSMLIGFIATLFGLGAAGFGIGIASFSLNEYLPYLFEGNWEQLLGYVSLGLVMLIPAIGLILLAMRLISDRYRVPRYIGFALPLLWLLGLIGLMIVSVSTLRDFQKTSTKIETVNIPTDANTLILQRENRSGDIEIEDMFQIKEGYFAVPINDDVTVKKSTTGYAYMELKLSGKGRTESRAAKSLSQIRYNYEVKDSLIRLENFLFLKEGQQWRNQKVKTTLFLPEGKNIIFRNVGDVESYENGSYSWHDVDSEKIYTFENNLLKCINCPEEEVNESETNSNTVTIGKGKAEIKLSDGKDSINIKINKNGTSNISISGDTDSIPD